MIQTDEPGEAGRRTRGSFITFEGGEGAGKTTQIKLLAAVLERQGQTVQITREPGGSPGGERIRQLLIGSDAQPFSPAAEALLFAAARRDHVDKLIRPALDGGQVVLCDRFFDSTRAYQGAARAVPSAMVTDLERWAAADCIPDLTFMLDLPVESGLARAQARRQATGGHIDGFERETIDFHEAIRKAFLDIARDHPARCLVVDASGTLGAVEAAILAGVTARLPHLVPAG